MSQPDKQAVKDYLMGLQDRICAALAETDSAEGCYDDADKKLPHVAPLPVVGSLPCMSASQG